MNRYSRRRLLAAAAGIGTVAVGAGGTARADVGTADCSSIPSTADPAVIRIVYQVGAGLGVSDRVMLAGFEAGWVESHMNNLPCGDRDSLGVFQQRPSQGWGTPEQIMNVAFASNSFFTRAVNVAAANPGWSAGRVAQAVQVSAFPDRYDAAEPIARDLIARARASASRQVYEAASNTGWQALPVSGSAGAAVGSVTASMTMGSNKLLYTVHNGNVYEASSDTGWRNLWTGISGVSSDALAVINVNGVKYIYTIAGGYVHEAASNNGWRNLNTTIGGVSASALAAINLNGVKLIYTVGGGGMVHEAASNNGWQNLHTGISGVGGSALAAITVNGVKYIYTIAGGYVHEAASNNGWRNLNSGIGGVNGNALAAINLNGIKHIYTVAGGYIHEAASNNGWRNLNSNVRGTSVSAITLNGVKILYTV